MNQCCHIDIILFSWTRLDKFFPMLLYLALIFLSLYIWTCMFASCKFRKNVKVKSIFCWDKFASVLNQAICSCKSWLLDWWELQEKEFILKDIAHEWYGIYNQIKEYFKTVQLVVFEPLKGRVIFLLLTMLLFNSWECPLLIVFTPYDAEAGGIKYLM